MTAGIIDVGSNTIRLSVFKCEGGGFHPLLSKKIVAGLASFVENNSLSAKGEERLCQSLEDFQSTLRELDIDSVHAFATASLRYVGNASGVTRRVQERTGIALELISGEEEARLSFLGAKRASGIADGLVVDVGGASCELINVCGGNPEQMRSLPMGCLSLYVGHVAGILATKEETRAMRDFVRLQLESVSEQFREQGRTLCCVGGTARAVYCLAQELGLVSGNDGVLESGKFRRVMRGLLGQDRAVYHAVGRAAPERIFTILPGAVILREIVKKSGAPELRIVRGGVREGYLLDKIIGEGSGNAC